MSTPRLVHGLLCHVANHFGLSYDGRVESLPWVPKYVELIERTCGGVVNFDLGLACLLPLGLGSLAAPWCFRRHAEGLSCIQEVYAFPVIGHAT